MKTFIQFLNEPPNATAAPPSAGTVEAPTGNASIAPVIEGKALDAVAIEKALRLKATKQPVDQKH